MTIFVCLMSAAALPLSGRLPTAPSALAEMPQESRTSAPGSGVGGAAGIAPRSQEGGVLSPEDRAGERGVAQEGP